MSRPFSRRASLGLPLALAFTSARDGHAQAGDSSRLRIGLAAAPTTIDPHFHADSANFVLARHMFETLIQWSPDGRLLPLLARRWRPLEDGAGWELEMDPAARFADGMPVTAGDAAASLTRAMTIPNSPGRFTPFLAGLIAAEAVSPSLLRLRTEGPTPLLPGGLPAILIIPERIALSASPADFNAGTAVMGSGPFELVEYRRGEVLLLRRNEAWWRPGGRPLPDWRRLELRIVAQDAARISGLLTGELDLIDNLPPQDLARVSRTPNTTVIRQPGTRIMFIALNQAEQLHPGQPNPMRDRRVREALSLAIDRQALASQVMGGEASPAGQLMPLSRVEADPAIRPPAPDRAAARRLLAEAGWGQGFRLNLIGTNNRYAGDDQLVQAVAQMWSQVGVEVEVEAMPSVSYFPRYGAGRFGAALGAWLTGPPEPNSFFTGVVAARDPARRRGAVNGTGYSNPRLDSMVDRALTNLDPAARLAIWREGARIVFAEDIAQLPLFHQASLWAMRSSVTYDARLDSLTLAMDARRASA